VDSSAVVDRSRAIKIGCKIDPIDPRTSLANESAAKGWRSAPERSANLYANNRAIEGTRCTRVWS